jgi:hypothetical protein
LFLSCVVIDASTEHWKVITWDMIPGAFMQADIDEVLHVRLEGPLAKLLTKVDPDLYTLLFLSKENGKDVMYVRAHCKSPIRHTAGGATFSERPVRGGGGT